MDDWTNTEIKFVETTQGHTDSVEETDIEQPKRMWELRQETKQRIIKLTQRKHFSMRKR